MASAPEKYQISEDVLLWCYHGQHLRKDYSFRKCRMFYAELRRLDESLIGIIGHAFDLCCYLDDPFYYDDDILQLYFLDDLPDGSVVLRVVDPENDQLFDMPLSSVGLSALKLSLEMSVIGTRSVSLDRAAEDPIYALQVEAAIAQTSIPTINGNTMSQFTRSYTGLINTILNGSNKHNAVGVALSSASEDSEGHKEESCCVVATRNRSAKVVFSRLKQNGLLPEGLDVPHEDHHCIKNVLEFVNNGQFPLN